MRQLIPDFKKITTLIEPFAPTWNSAELAYQPFFHYASGGDVVDKPIMLEVSDNEGWGFIDTVFQNVEGNNVTVSDERWRQLIDFLFEGVCAIKQKLTVNIHK